MRERKDTLIADNPEAIRGTLGNGLDEHICKAHFVAMKGQTSDRVTGKTEHSEKTDWPSATIAAGPNTNIFIWGAVIERPLTDDPNSTVDLEREQCYMRP